VATLHLLLKTKGDLQLIETTHNDPLFYLIRRYADRLWYTWQKTHGYVFNGAPHQRDNEFDQLYFRGLSVVTLNPKFVVQEGQYLHDYLRVGDGLNPQSDRVGGLMCYTYEDPKPPTRRWHQMVNPMNWRPGKRQ
jgi:hypothetical protein